jgi:hypothetical protein
MTSRSISPSRKPIAGMPNAEVHVLDAGHFASALQMRSPHWCWILSVLHVGGSRRAGAATTFFEGATFVTAAWGDLRCRDLIMRGVYSWRVPREGAWLFRLLGLLTGGVEVWLGGLGLAYRVSDPFVPVPH